jgi:putative tricarboxylic transport membrane protein
VVRLAAPIAFWLVIPKAVKSIHQDQLHRLQGERRISAIIGGHVTAGVSGVGEFAEQIKGGRMRALAVSAPKREEGIRTLKEQRINVELANWRGIFGASGITRQQRDALVKLVKAATESAAWKETLEARLVADLLAEMPIKVC